MGKAVGNPSKMPVGSSDGSNSSRILDGRADGIKSPRTLVGRPLGSAPTMSDGTFEGMIPPRISVGRAVGRPVGSTAGIRSNYTRAMAKVSTLMFRGTK